MHLASGLPCALCFQRDDDEPKLGHDVPRECEVASGDLVMGPQFRTFPPLHRNKIVDFLCG